MLVTKYPRTFSVALSAVDRRLLEALASYEERRPGDALRVALREAARRRGLPRSEWLLPDPPSTDQLFGNASDNGDAVV